MYGRVLGMRTLAVVAAAVFAAVWFAGCGGDSSDGSQGSTAPGTAETATIEVEDADSGEVTKVTVTGSGRERTISAAKEDGTSGSMTIGTGKIPAEFPEDFPRYEGWEVKSVVNTNQGDKKGFVVMATTSDSTDKVIASFEKALGEKGYKINGKMTMPQGTNIMVEKDKIVAVVTIGVSGDKTVINVTLEIKP